MKNCNSCDHGNFCSELVDNNTSGTQTGLPTQVDVNQVWTDLTCLKDHKRKYGINKCKDYNKKGDI